MARIKRYNSETGQWEYCNTGGMPIKGIDYLTKADYDTMRADIDAYLERNKESVGVTVSGNQTGDDIIGAIVRIVGEDGSVLEEKTWNGSELIFKLEAGTVYHVEADASEFGFTSYTSGTFTAVKGGARTVVAEVYAEKVNVSVEGIDSGFTVTVKEEYTQVEYIESSGSQYIDTGFAPNQDTKIEMAASIFAFDSDQYLYGAKDSGSTKSYVCAFSDSAMVFGYASQFPSGAYIPNSGEKFYITQDKNIGYINGAAVIEATAATFQSPVSLYLCARNNEGTLSKLTKVRIYSCKIYDNGTLVRDYIPVMNSSGVYGLYDKVNGVFYSSATSTGFTGSTAQAKTFLTLTETSGSCLIPYGTVYSVSATAVDGYISPSTQTFTASSVSRDIVMTYEELFVGVAIMGVNGRLYMDAASWQAAGSPAVNGVAVSDGTHRFCIAKSVINRVCYDGDYADQEYWGASDVTVSGVTITTDSSTAKADFNGVANTDGIVANVKSSDNYFTKSPWSAAGLCRQFTFPNGAAGYLGACGEWNLVQGSVSTINTLMSAIGGAQIEISTYPYYWSSTQYDSEDVWIWTFNNEGCSHFSKYFNFRVRAFCSF